MTRATVPLLDFAPIPEARSPTSVGTDDPFYYGIRYLERVGRDGEIILDEIPLTLDDLLHPQEGDQVSETFGHLDANDYVAFVGRFVVGEHGLVLRNCLIDWGVPGIKPHAPDFAVFLGIQRPPGNFGTFYCAQHGNARADLVIEITSKKTRPNDVDPKRKLGHYEKVGVKQYVIIDLESPKGPQIHSYNLVRGVFRKTKPDSHGRVLLRVLKVRAGLEDGKLALYDAATGAYIPPPVPALHLAIAEKERAIAEKGEAIAEKEKVLAESQTVIAEKEEMLAEKDEKLAEKDEMLAEKDEKLAEKDQKLAEQDELLAEMQRRIKELEKKVKKHAN